MCTCNYCGRENDRAAVHCRECGTEFPTDPVMEPPPETPALELIAPEAFADAFRFEGGSHRPDWEFIRRWIDDRFAPGETETAWNDAALLWLQRLRDDLGGGYSVHQSHRTLLLCDQPRDTARWLLDYAGTAGTAILERLGNVAWPDRFGKDVILIFSDEDDYYEYVAYHTPDGEQAASSGVCVHTGYTHIAAPWQDPRSTASIIVHELIHGGLSHLPLPLWLNEGVAVTLERAIAPPTRALGESHQATLDADLLDWRAPVMWDELAERHFNFWTGQNIQSFWAGTSFYIPGDSNELSYSLAEVLFKHLTERADRAAFHAFLRRATQEDAGQSAAVEILGVDLGEIAGTFLGTGSWRPRRQSIAECWITAGWASSGGS